MKESKRFLITGGAGFIGSALIRYIIQNTKNSVVNLDKLTYASNLVSLKAVEESPRYKFEKVDICNFDDVKRVIVNYRPEIIIHLAAESHVDRSIGSPGDFIQTNIFGTYALLEATREYWSSLNADNKASFRFHHVSTDEVYGDLHKSDELFSESSRYSPSSPYSASKASSDHLVRAWHRTFNLPTIVSNCSNNYGPFQFSEKLIPKTILNAINGRNIPIYGNGQQIRDWLYVEDHVTAILKVAFEGTVGETYNVGGNNQVTNIDVATKICEIIDSLLPINKNNNILRRDELISFVPDRPGHDIKYAIDASKITNELKWKPSESFESGIKKTIEWYISNSKWYKNVEG